VWQSSYSGEIDRAQQISTAEAPAAPQRVAGRYHVEAELGRGGMGVVYRCFDASTGQRLALKKLLIDGGSRERLSALFEREYHTLAGLKHPRIIEVYDYGIDEGAPYYTMELLPGQDLRDLSPLPWREASRYLRDVASSLALLHARRLLHRDVSSRNVRLTGEGRAKLLDFGALTSFGVAPELVGTPPGIAPEALRGAALDQRSDLYSLGALFYWALTARHAYPARSVRDLIDVWRYTPAPPSAWSADVPPALDELVMSLLRLDALARPTSAGEVIDRVNGIAGLEPEEGLEAGQSYLLSSVFVGRAEPMERLRKRLRRALSGSGGSMLIEGTSGMGRTALLGELLLDAQLQGATVLHAEARVQRGPYGVVRALFRGLLTALPELGLRTLQPHLPVLAHTSPELQKLAGSVQLADLPTNQGERRARIRSAIEDWLLATAAERTLLILVDDFQASDEDSAAILTTLAHASKQHRLLIVATASASEPCAVAGSVEAFRERSGRITLRGLDKPAVDQLVKAFFGDVPNAARVAAWLYELSAGTPSQCMELLRHLVNKRVVRYTAGTWVLAHELVSSELPSGVDEALAARVAALHPNARALAEVLSIQRGALSLSICTALAAAHGDRVYEMLDELVAEGVLIRADDAYAFAQETLRESVACGLSPEQRRLQHQQLGQVLLAAKPTLPEDRIEAGWHLLHGGDELAGAQLLSEAAMELAMCGEGTAMAAPALEAALEVFQRAGRRPTECLGILVPLTIAGYYADRRLTMRYGEVTYRTLLDLTGGSLAARLWSWLPARLRLFVGLVGGAFRVLGLPKYARPPTIRHAFLGLFGCAAAMAAVYTSCYELEKLRTLTRALEPYMAFGRRHVASIVYRLNVALTDNARGAHADALESLLRLTQELAVPGRLKALPNDVRMQLYAGVLYMCAITEMLQGQSNAFERALQLEQSGMLFYRMHAELLRMFHHACRGEADLADQYREKVELHALRGGISWYMALFIPMRMLHCYHLTRDIVGLKRLAEQLDRVGAELPGIIRSRDLARARIELLRGNARAALALYERSLPQPAALEFLGWPLECANYAEALNEAGEHERAKQLCLVVSSRARPQDRVFKLRFQAAEQQLALAEASLGDSRAAADRLDALIACAGTNPLLSGALHRDRARVALGVLDTPAFEQHFARMEEWFRSTHNPALIVQCEQLAGLAAKAGLRPATDDQRSKLSGWLAAASGVTSASAVHSLLSQCVKHDARAERALDMIVSQAGAERGYLYLNKDRALYQAAPQGDDAPSTIVVQLREAMERMVESLEAAENDNDQHDTQVMDATRSHGAAQVFQTIVLVSHLERQPAVVGAVALVRASKPLTLPRADFLEALAHALHDAGDCTKISMRSDV
jgi:hypothetical protein